MTADLITRLESADGPDRELFEAAFDVALPEPSKDWRNWPQDRIEKRDPGDRAAFTAWLEWDKRRQNFHRMLDAEAWTSAAEMLVPEKYRDDFIITNGGCFLGPDYMYFSEGYTDFSAYAEHTALALAAAALKARGV